MASPLCAIQNGSAAAVAAGYGANITPGNLVTISLVDPTNVFYWYLKFVASSIGSPPSLTVSGTTATFVAPANGTALVVDSGIYTAAGPIQGAQFALYCAAPGYPHATFAPNIADSMTNMLAASARARGMTPLNSRRARTAVVGIAQTLAAQPMLDGENADLAGTMYSVYVAMGSTAFAAGESVALTVKKNGVSILSAPVSLTSATPAGAIVDCTAQLTSLGIAVNLSDSFTVDHVYTPGSSPAYPSYSVFAVWGNG